MRSFLNVAYLSKAAVTLTMLGSSAAAVAQTQAAQTKSQSPWEVSLGAGLVSTAEYEGASKTVASAMPDVNVSYRTQSFGTFGLGVKSRGFSWTITETDDCAFGLTLASSSGRTDKKDGTLYKPGSKRLRGMGEIKPGSEFGVFGQVNLGVPVMLQVMRGMGDGKTDSRDFSIDGHDGTTVQLSVKWSLQATPELALSVSPNLVWADKNYTQTYFGVSNAQAARSGFKAFTAQGGLKSVGLDVGLSYQLAPNWSANAGASFSQLSGDAEKSPIVQKKGQTSAFAGVSYGF